MTNIEALAQRVQAMRNQFARRDGNIFTLKMVREGRMHEVPGMNRFFSTDLPRSIVKNAVDKAAMDYAMLMGTLPDLACASGNGTTHKDKRRGENKDKAGRYVWSQSRLETEILKFADHYNTYGVGVFCVEPNFEEGCPVIRVEDPENFYYFKDRWGRLQECAKVYHRTCRELASLYPEFKAHLDRGEYSADHSMEVVRYSAPDGSTIIYACGSTPIILAHIPAALHGRLAYFIAERPGIHKIPTGEFDEAQWLQYAQVIMAHYRYRAMDLAINAPIDFPMDATELEMGIGTVIKSSSNKPIRRVDLSIPPQLFAYAEQLDQEVQAEAGLTASRLGQVNANIITGRGVEALAGGLDTQVKTAQTIFKRALEDATDYAFRLFHQFWPEKTFVISGVESGQSYEFKFVPSRDLGDDYSCTVTYGFMLGNSPAQALLMLQQMQASGVISTTTVQRKIPFDVDVNFEQREIEVLRMREGLLSGMLGYGQSLPAQAAQGADPRQVVVAMATAIKKREKGQPLEDAVLEAFPLPEPPAGEASPVVGGEVPGGPPGANLPPGLQASGLMQGVPPGQAGLNPGAQPDIHTMIASLRGENPQLSSTTLTRRAV